jgi:hypothetical protein
MRTSFTRSWSVLLLLLLVFVAMFAPGCTCDGGRPAAKRSTFACLASGKVPKSAGSLQNKIFVPGAISTSPNTTESGAAVLTMSLESLPGPAGMAPAIALHYNSDDNNDQGLGVGFSISAGSVITPRAKTLLLDDEVKGIQYNDDDAFAIDEKPLVPISESAEQIEYRTFPDSQVKVIGYLEGKTITHFVAFLPTGNRIFYTGRPKADTGMPLAWLAEEQRDPRGNSVHYDWCLANDENGVTVEYALTLIRYAQNKVVFDYDERADPEVTYAAGTPIQQSLRLSAVRMVANDELVRQYDWTYQ